MQSYFQVPKPRALEDFFNHCTEFFGFIRYSPDRGDVCEPNFLTLILNQRSAVINGLFIFGLFIIILLFNAYIVYDSVKGIKAKKSWTINVIALVLGIYNLVFCFYAVYITDDNSFMNVFNLRIMFPLIMVFSLLFIKSSILKLLNSKNNLLKILLTILILILIPLYGLMLFASASIFLIIF